MIEKGIGLIHIPVAKFFIFCICFSFILDWVWIYVARLPIFLLLMNKKLPLYPVCLCKLVNTAFNTFNFENSYMSWGFHSNRYVNWQWLGVQGHLINFSCGILHLAVVKTLTDVTGIAMGSEACITYCTWSGWHVTFFWLFLVFTWMAGNDTRSRDSIDKIHKECYQVLCCIVLCRSSSKDGW